jgi:hypothetical protein
LNFGNFDGFCFPFLNIRLSVKVKWGKETFNDIEVSSADGKISIGATSFHVNSAFFDFFLPQIIIQATGQTISSLVLRFFWCAGRLAGIDILKAHLFSLTSVPTDRQKLLIKGKQLKVSHLVAWFAFLSSNQ